VRLLKGLVLLPQPAISAVDPSCFGLAGGERQAPAAVHPRR
jgi:hypothetical protein